MRFLADQDVWKQTMDLIKAWGHDLITAGEIGLARALLNHARNENRLFITRDNDYGSLVFLGRTPSGGVILLRIRCPTLFTTANGGAIRPFLYETSVSWSIKLAATAASDWAVVCPPMTCFSNPQNGAILRAIAARSSMLLTTYL